MHVSGPVHALHLPFTVPVAPGQSMARFVYVYVILGERITLIDSGVDGCETPIRDYLAQQGRSPHELDTLILTHAHPDHIGAAHPIVAACQCAVLAHPAEQDWIEDPAIQQRERPVPGFDHLVAGPVTVTQTLTDGDLLELSDAMRVRVIHTPGHSHGSISLWDEAHGTLFSGDAIPQPGDLPIYDDAADSIDSLLKLLDLPRLDLLLSAWDRPRRGAEATQALHAGLDYLRTIHQAVGEVTQQRGPTEPMALCQAVVARIGLPDVAVNPLVARSFCSHLTDAPSISAMLGIEPW